MTPAGIYIHVPFCLKKCGYCDFYSVTDLGLAKAYTKSVINEIKGAVFYPYVYDTVYFGGGTPSVLPIKMLNEITDAVRKYLSPALHCEYTIEANPGALTKGKITAFKKMGFNRINIGVQSVNDGALKFLTRVHNRKQAYKAVRLSREAGFENMGLDLIYGLPGQNKEAWMGELREVTDIEPEHLSCYLLTLEKGTPFYRSFRKKEFVPIADDEASRLFLATSEFLKEKGYLHYEISNFARKKEYASRHNMKYWSFVPYLGFGPSAHSYTGNTRFKNITDIREYIHARQVGRSFISDTEYITSDQLIIECIYLGLRTSAGIDITSFEKQTGEAFLKNYGACIKGLIARNLAVLEKNRFRLTTKGMLLLDGISSTLASLTPDC